ncbi:hypothetical protein METBIDRAFT_38605 [Metschnikowia bicuspidata var. bicuspidata NRRL YB-4993]|uniref:t-SNARE coiled-coil homology domain-containing protein n=1 Tax=Metschnikowia bicuspidata var. bicuspidata NRRL YB-4993 TaxID=869754 RepID=A0A1A0HHJ1_9ASCO|nr:hypothetical protein METBIDRAFT_38605 [Metschnikowia bicuspidata var. bicuspidata NRRL YB-4993]OBA23313.1 hypothetical protein METBIDRAFT_38605 [Metschnikowia bicuspidata var. bicuspidata NRRL YB-4993]
MSVSTKSIKTQLQKVNIYIEQLGDLLDERERLVSVLHLTPSNLDNLDVINLLAKIKAGLDYAQEDLSSGISKDLSAELLKVAKAYSEAAAPLQDDVYINIEEYLFEPLRNDEQSTKKSVRFKDYDSEEEVDETTQMRNQLMGTSGNFKPYKDSTGDPESEDSVDADRNTLLSVDTSNQEMFAQHQQQMLEQDQNLDVLHQSIRTQHRMGAHINEELDEHLILLNDLEEGVDGSHTRIRRATNGIVKFRRKAKENGSLVTIVVLTVILILLLVVLN